MNRFLIPSLDIISNQIIITDSSQIHHLRDVLRLKEGKTVVISNGRGEAILASIKKIDPKSIELTVKSRIKPATRKISMAIACAIPKKSKFDDIIDKLTQVGADRIIPLKTERTIVKLAKEKEEARLNRWNKIVLNASQQSQRSTLPKVESLTDIKSIIKRSDEFHLKLIPALDGERKTIKEVLSRVPDLPVPANILVLIGPEGDFTENEVSLAKKAGFIPVTLGSLVLRVETAAIAVASFISLYEAR